MKYLITLVIIIITFTACSTQDLSPSEPITTPDTSVEIDAATWLYLTLEELSVFNGKDQQPAYIAVDGTIYDVTQSGPWSNGMHNGYEAGKDLTEAMRDVSPHGFSKLDNIEAIGTLVD